MLSCPSFIGVRTESATIYPYHLCQSIFLFWILTSISLHIEIDRIYMCIPISESTSIYLYVFRIIYTYIRDPSTYIYTSSVHETGNWYGANKLPQWFGLQALFVVYLCQWLDSHAMFLSMGLRASSRSGVSVHPQVLAYLMITNKPFKWHLQVTIT